MNASTRSRYRALGHTAFPYVYPDATYINVRDDPLGQVVSRAVVVATGITADGEREVLGVDIGDSTRQLNTSSSTPDFPPPRGALSRS